MADEQRRVEEREEEERGSEEAPMDGIPDVLARDAPDASMPSLHVADELREELEEEERVEEEERDHRRRGGSPIRGPMGEEEEELRRKRKREVGRGERKDSKRRRQEEEGERVKELGELSPERRKVKEKSFQSEPDNFSSLRKITKRFGLRKCGTQPHLPEAEFAEGDLGWSSG